MRLVARLMIAGVALATGGLMAGCSSAVVPDAQGATNPAVIPSPVRAVTATVPAVVAHQPSPTVRTGQLAASREANPFSVRDRTRA